MSESERPKNLPEWSACSPVPYMTLGSEPDGTVTVEGGAFDAGDVQAFTLNGVRFVRAPEWTKEKPTVPGHYWLRAADYGVPDVIRVEEDRGVHYGWRTVDGVEHGIDVYGGVEWEWAGPIPAPLEPEPTPAPAP